MLRNKLVRSDGSVIDSSVIISCEFSEEVNRQTNLTVGDVTSSELTVEIRSTEAIQQGEVLTYYMIEDGVEKRIGEFNVEKPTVASRTSIKFSAYDNIVKTEKVFSGWLRENQNLFPMTLGSLVQRACDYCGVTLATAYFPMYDLSVPAFYADDITCRQIIAWAGMIAGKFVRANSTGGIEFAWYAPATLMTVTPGDNANASNIDVYDDGRGNITVSSDDMTVTDDGDGNVVIVMSNVVISEKDGNVTISSNAIPYMSGGLSYETYSTDVIRRVQIKHSDDDVGVIYPADVTGNCFAISGNMLLGVCSTEDVTRVAEHLYDVVSGISYVPVTVNVFRTIGIRAGDIISIRDHAGNNITTYVMKVAVSPSGTTITSTGDKSYGENAAVASERFSNLTGKILSIKKSVDGLEVKNEDLKGSVSSIKATTDAIETKVSGVEVEVSDTKKTVSELSTTFTETKSSFEMQFEQTSKDVGALQEESKTQSSYIRFVDGNIQLGRSDSSIILILKNDKVSFFNGSKEVAYVSKDKLYITDGEFLTNLYIGKFGLTPRETTGNLSFRKVVN
jgi:hypothetical protein